MSFNRGNNIIFPNLGIEFNKLGKSITVFGLDIAFYGMIIAIAAIVGYKVAQYQAKRSGQDPELYLDFALVLFIPAILGARLYYVISEWDTFKDDIIQIFNLRTGGLAIYGGVLAGIISAIVFCRVKK